MIPSRSESSINPPTLSELPSNTACTPEVLRFSSAVRRSTSQGAGPALALIGDVALDLVGAEHALERVHNRRACRIVVHHARIGDDAVVIGECKMSRHRRYRCGRQDRRSRSGCRHDRCAAELPDSRYQKRPSTPEPGEQTGSATVPRCGASWITLMARGATCSTRRVVVWTGVACRKPESAAGMPDGMTPPGVNLADQFRHKYTR